MATRLLHRSVGRGAVLAGAALVLALGTLTARSAATPAPSPNGIPFPEGYRDWALIGVSHRTDNGSLRAIIGNDVAVRAAREGRTNPWPDGAVLGKLVWKDATHGKWPAATVPGRFVHAEFMFKNAVRWPETGGWGFARWLGAEQKPYGRDGTFVQECFGCHTPVKDNDYVFTRPVVLP